MENEIEYLGKKLTACLNEYGEERPDMANVVIMETMAVMLVAFFEENTNDKGKKIYADNFAKKMKSYAKSYRVMQTLTGEK